MKDAILSGLKGPGGAALLALPAAFFAAALLLRHAGGPYWEWHIVDPSYFYLFDALHLAQFTLPGHPYHPGTPVQMVGAVALRLTYPLASAADLTAAVLADPEAHLRLLGNVLLGLIAGGLLAAGVAVRVLTGNLILALLLQTAPFLSMVILKNAYHVKPESLLILVALALSVAVLAAGRAWGSGGLPGRWIAALGAMAGFGVATKLTAAPLFLLPLFLLGGWRGLVAYGASAAAAFLLFTAPALPNFAPFLDLAANALTHSGPYSSGDKAVIDMAVYPRAVFGVASRPVVHLQLLFGLAALAVWAWRRRRGLAVPAFELRALAGLTLAVFVAVLAVAMQPTANYMIPIYMQMPLAVILLVRFVAGLKPWDAAFRRRAARAGLGALAVVIAVQATAVGREYADLASKKAQARRIDDGLFAACARIYFFPASSPSFALFLGDWWTGGRHGAAVAAQVPANNLWFEQNIMALRDATGARDLGRVLADNKCVFLRGGHPGPISGYLAAQAPGVAFDSSCSTRDETVLTRGVDCRGNPK